MILEEIKQIIPNSETFEELIKLNLGWSDEEKYVIKKLDKTRVLLRILTKENFCLQKQAITMLDKFSKISKQVPKVLEYDETIDGKNGYILLDFIEGFNAMQKISEYTIKEQYDFGFKMGETIKKFHKQSNPIFIEEESNKFRDKVNNFLNYYCQNKNQFDFLSDKEKFIKDFLKVIENRPFVMLHNDFHLGNMIVNKNNISLIDFNRASYGDFVKEFDGIAWSVKTSKYFAQGIIDAYIEDEYEDEFFKLLKGYINIWQIQMLTFIKDQDEEEKRIVIDLLKSVEKWYDENSSIPNWYNLD